MKKIMISQPMAGKSDNEIVETRNKFLRFAKENNFEVVNTLFTDYWSSDENMKSLGVEVIPLCYLAKSLENMAKCHMAYFADGWQCARGCKIEHDAAVAYGLEIIYE